MTEEIAIAAFVRDRRLLLGHRHPARQWYPDCWDLVGGHIEPGESPEQAVRRECREELDVQISCVQPIPVDLADPTLRAHAFRVVQWTGEPVNAAPEEHDDLAWFTAGELDGLRLAHPSYPGWLPTLVSDPES